MAWFEKKQPLLGRLLFRGELPLNAADFSNLESAGINVSMGSPAPYQRWLLELTHPQWGRANLSCPRQTTVPVSRPLISHDPRLTQDEKASLPHARSVLHLSMEAHAGHILRDRKRFLRFAHAVLGNDGVAAVDLLSQAIWTIDTLQDELTHDADLDVLGIFTTHAVTEKTEDGRPRTLWAHTHGLQEIGFFDFDMIRPSDDAISYRTDVVRAIAFAILERKVTLDGEGRQIMLRMPPIRFVSTSRFLASAQGREYRSDIHESHTTGHGIACDVIAQGLFARMFGRSIIRPARFLSEPFPDAGIIGFSPMASELMAQRARSTLALLTHWTQEFDEFRPQCLVKLRCATSSGGAEYPWFELHRCTDRLDATCVNDPVDIPGLHKGDRGDHPIDTLYDWLMFLPFGTLSPRQTSLARELRAHRDELRDQLKAASHGAGQQSGSASR